MNSHTTLSRRERQIMDIVYAQGEASATAVQAQIPQPPSRTAVRTMLRILEEKGHLRHRKQGRQFIYRPTRTRAKAGISALRRVLETFYDGSLEEAVAAHLGDAKSNPSREELERLSLLIDSVKEGVVSSH